MRKKTLQEGQDKIIESDEEDSDSSYFSSSEEKEEETMEQYVERMRREFCAQSANKVPEIYQHYFQNGDEDGDTNAKKGGSKKPALKKQVNKGMSRMSGGLHGQNKG